MPLTYFPCQYVPPGTNIPCGVFFPETPDLKLHYCPTHQNILETATESPEAKTMYIDARNAEIKYCHEMTIDELDIHIAMIETQIAELKVKFYSARGVRGDKIEKLSDTERAARREWKAANVNEPKVKTVKSKDPVTHLGSKLGVNKADAKDLMNMDVEALLAKYAAAKEKNA